MSTQSPVRRATSLFHARFGTRPTVAASAPGRVNLIGEHLDYNGGPVLPVAVRRRLAVAVAPAERWEAVSELHEQVAGFDPEAPPGDQWTDYLAGTVRALRAGGAAPPAARIAVASGIPVGAGLASSAALCLALTKALSRLAGRRLGAAALAEVAWHAEADEVGVPVGRMDQVVGAHARANMALHFDADTGAIEHVPCRVKLHLFETGVTHALRDGTYGARVAECEAAAATLRGHGVLRGPLARLPLDRLEEAVSVLPAPVGRRVRHVVTETERVERARHALARGHDEALGPILFEGQASLRENMECSCPEADLLVETLAHHGALGARLTGAGWGGAVIALLPEARATGLVERARRVFEAAYGRTPETWSTRAAGAVRSEPAER